MERRGLALWARGSSKNKELDKGSSSFTDSKRINFALSSNLLFLKTLFRFKIVAVKLVLVIVNCLLHCAMRATNFVV